MSIFWIAVLCELSNQPFDSVAALILALVTFAVYALDHAGDSKEDLLNTPERAWLARYHVEWIALGVYFVAAVITAYWDLQKLPCVLVVGLAGAIYARPIAGIRLKSVPGVKTFIVASSTAICRVGLIGGAAWLYILVFLVMIIDTVLCDMRDIRGDTATNVRTLPVMFGRGRTLAILAAVDALMFTFLSQIVAVAGAFLIIFFRKERPGLSYDLLVDGWMLWVAILLFVYGDLITRL